MEAAESQDLPPRPLARHLSDADRLRKVIQELVDTEKSYVKVMGSAGHSYPFVDGEVTLAEASAWNICHLGYRHVLLEVN